MLWIFYESGSSYIFNFTHPSLTMKRADGIVREPMPQLVVLLLQVHQFLGKGAVFAFKLDQPLHDLQVSLEDDVQRQQPSRVHVCFFSLACHI